MCYNIFLAKSVVYIKSVDFSLVISLVFLNSVSSQIDVLISFKIFINDPTIWISRSMYFNDITIILEKNKFIWFEILTVNSDLTNTSN